MGDDDDFVIENADAGASTTIPMEAGQIKKGGYAIMMMMNDNDG
jgi:translation initiation factor 5A